MNNIPNHQPDPYWRENLALQLRTNLLRECLPILLEKELGTQSSPVLRALIADVTYATKQP